MMDYPKVLEDRTVLIDGEPFHVDIGQKCLVRTDVPEQKISMDDLKDEGDFLTTILDRGTKQVRRGMIRANEQHTVLYVVLDWEIFTVSFWKDKEAIRKLNEKSVAMGNHVLMVDERLRQRLGGKLPTMMIGNDEFTIDIRLDELRYIDELKFSQIPISGHEMDITGDHYLFLYDHQQKCEYDFDHNMTELPAHVSAIALPNELVLDSVGYCVKLGISPLSMIHEFPIREKLQAKVIPFSKTKIPRILKQNRQRASQQNKTPAARKTRGRKI